MFLLCSIVNLILRKSSEIYEAIIKERFGRQKEFEFLIPVPATLEMKEAANRGGLPRPADGTGLNPVRRIWRYSITAEGGRLCFWKSSFFLGFLFQVSEWATGSAI